MEFLYIFKMEEADGFLVYNKIYSWYVEGNIVNKRKSSETGDWNRMQNTYTFRYIIKVKKKVEIQKRKDCKLMILIFFGMNLE